MSTIFQIVEIGTARSAQCDLGFSCPSCTNTVGYGAYSDCCNLRAGQRQETTINVSMRGWPYQGQCCVNVDPNTCATQDHAGIN